MLPDNIDRRRAHTIVAVLAQSPQQVSAGFRPVLLKQHQRLDAVIGPVRGVEGDPLKALVPLFTERFHRLLDSRPAPTRKRLRLPNRRPHPFRLLPRRVGPVPFVCNAIEPAGRIAPAHREVDHPVRTYLEVGHIQRFAVDEVHRIIHQPVRRAVANRAHQHNPAARPVSL